MANPLKFVLWNSNGLLSRKLEFDHFLQKEKVDIACVTETHCTQKYHVAHTANFNVYHAFHPSTKARGGSALYIKKTIPHSIGHTLSTEKIQMVSTLITYQGKKVTLAALYCTPSQKIDAVDFDLVFSQLGNCWIAGGDFNAKHAGWGSQKETTRGRSLMEVIQRRKLDIHSNGQPTYWPTDAAKVPDVIDFYISKNFSQSSTKVLTDLTSDHLPVILETMSGSVLPIKKVGIVTKNTDWNKFQEIVSAEVPLGTKISTVAQLNTAAAQFSELLRKAAKSSTPDTTPLPSPAGGFTTQISCLVAKRRRARHLWQQHRTPDTKQAFNQISNKVTKELRKLRDQRLSDFLTTLAPTEDRNYSLWRATRKFRRAPVQPIPPLCVDSKWYKEDTEKVELFASHLERTFTPNDIPTSADLTLTNLQAKRISPFSPKEVASEIDRLNVRKAPGADQISGSILKRLPRKGILWLTYILNSILRLQAIPDEWKRAKIIMIHKTGKPINEIKSYRPISLLPICNKIFEKLFLRRIKRVLPQHYLPDHQFGFREKHSPVDQVHRVTNIISSALESKSFCAAAFLDVSQAFDRVWHDGLLVKLSKLLPTNYCLLLKHYLTNRSFFVTYGQADSPLHPIRSGVPQGSVLGPFLFTLFAADAPLPNNNTSIATFADDTVILSTAQKYKDAVSQLQLELTKFADWTKQWKITINGDKSVHVDFSLRPHAYEPLYFNQDRIPTALSARYLGVHLDQRLTFATHINTKRLELEIRLRKMAWLLAPQSSISLANKRLLYLSTLRPIWAYAIQIWGCASRHLRLRIQRFQNKVLKLLCGTPWYVRREVLHKDLRIPYVDEVISRHADRHIRRLHTHRNVLAIELLDNSTTLRRLKRTHILDLPDST